MTASKRDERMALAALAGAGTYALICFFTARAQEGLALTALSMVALSGAIVAGFSFFHAMLVRLAEQERLERDDLQKEGAMFTGDRAESEVRRRNLGQYEKYVLPSVVIVLGLLEFTAAIYLFQTAGGVAPRREMLRIVAAVTIVAGVALYLAGSYLAGLAFGGNARTLRAIAGELVGLAWFSAMVGGITLTTIAELGMNIDAVAALILAGILLIRAVERVFGVLAQAYRSRRRGAKQLIYESRIGGTLAQPGGVLGRLADSLNYQFGVNATPESLRRAGLVLAPAVLLFHGVVLLAFSCLVVVHTGEEAVLERWGAAHPQRPVLGEGIHLKLPWPIEKVYRRNVMLTRSISVGMNKVGPHEPVGMWSGLGAGKLDEYLTPGPSETGGSSINLAAAVGFMQYRIRDIRDYVYRCNDAERVLKILLRRELVNVIGHVDVLAEGGDVLDSMLARAMQRAVDQREMGIEVVSAGARYLQPPATLVPSYQDVVAGEEQRMNEVLKAKGEQIALVTKKKTEAERIRSEATAYRDQKLRLASVGAENFEQLLPLYREHRTIFKARAYFDLLEKLSDNRKIVLATEVDRQVINLDLKKSKAELFDLMEQSEK